MRALICGISGQDGSLLANFLLDKGYEIWGTSRDIQSCSLRNLKSLGIEKDISLLSMAPNDFRSVYNAFQLASPDEVYNLSGQTSVGLSFEQPVETLESIITGTLNILEVIRTHFNNTKFYNAGSGECFGDTNNMLADEATTFAPTSPYGIAKASAQWLVSNYRQSYNLHASTGILFNHESQFRPKRFVTQKIIYGVQDVISGKSQKIVLGLLDIKRDWGWASEYVEVMWKMLQQEIPDDFVVATGQVYSLRDFIEHAFKIYNLEWRDYVHISTDLLRPLDIKYSGGSSYKATKVLNWQPKYNMYKIVEAMSECAAKSNHLT
jgi:GDPmannose 4,6-dehydratase